MLQTRGEHGKMTTAHSIREAPEGVLDTMGILGYLLILAGVAGAGVLLVLLVRQKPEKTTEDRKSVV